MTKLADQSWLLIYDPDLTTEARVETARKLHRRRGFDAVRTTAAASIILLHELADDPQGREAFRPGPPSPDVLAFLDEGTAQLAEQVWNLLFGSVLTDLDGIADPFILSELGRLTVESRDAVFLCAWVGIRAVATLAKYNPDSFVVHMQHARRELDRIAS